MPNDVPFQKRLRHASSILVIAGAVLVAGMTQTRLVEAVSTGRGGPALLVELSPNIHNLILGASVAVALLWVLVPYAIERTAVARTSVAITAGLTGTLYLGSWLTGNPEYGTLITTGKLALLGSLAVLLGGLLALGTMPTIADRISRFKETA